ncbi:MAG: hypothetical protein LC746_11440, partial [Acidobacteria bacterium]|nr:hypothetical protein [Acidobacteriota bacterium]
MRLHLRLPRRRRLGYALVSTLCALAAASLPLTVASCRAQQARPAPPQTVERLRALTHADVDRLPAESAV